jgi:starvation-inducible outer membrane lipoprotein
MIMKTLMMTLLTTTMISVLSGCATVPKIEDYNCNHPDEVCYKRSVNIMNKPGGRNFQ